MVVVFPASSGGRRAVVPVAVTNPVVEVVPEGFGLLENLCAVEVAGPYVAEVVAGVAICGPVVVPVVLEEPPAVVRFKGVPVEGLERRVAGLEGPSWRRALGTLALAKSRGRERGPWCLSPSCEPALCSFSTRAT